MPSDAKPADGAKPTDGTRYARRSIFQLTAYQAEDKPAETKPSREFTPAEDKLVGDKPA